jgi:WD40 repeat protein
LCIKPVTNCEVAIGSIENTIKLFNIFKSDSCIKTFSGHTNHVWCLEVYDNKKKLVSGSYDNTVKVWSLITGECLHTFNMEAKVIALMIISSDNKMAVGLSATKNLKIVDLESRQIVKTLNDQTSLVVSFHFDQDRRMLICGCDDKTIQLRQF